MAETDRRRATVQVHPVETLWSPLNFRKQGADSVSSTGLRTEVVVRTRCEVAEKATLAISRWKNIPICAAIEPPNRSTRAEKSVRCCRWTVSAAARRRSVRVLWAVFAASMRPVAKRVKPALVSPKNVAKDDRADVKAT